jgi:ribosomal protein L29
MKRQDLNKYHHQTRPQLESEITSMEKKLVEARLKKQLGQLKDLLQPSKIRRDIARLKTIIRFQQLQDSTALKKPSQPEPTAPAAKVKPAAAKETNKTTSKTKGK